MVVEYKDWAGGRKRMVIYDENGRRVSTSTMEFDDPLFPHGTAYGRRLGCKCEPCCEAYSLQQAERYRRNGRVSPDTPFVMGRGKHSVNKRKPITHGTRSGYVRGCHCKKCKRANADYSRVWMRQRRAGLSMRDPMMEGLLP